MGKYVVAFQISLAERFTYRADFFISTFLRFIPIITTILLWRAIYDGSGGATVGGLEYGQMVGYYLLVMVSRAFGSMPRLAGAIALDIREGGLRKYLLQPINYITYNIVLRASHKLTYFVMASGPYALVFWMCRDYMPGWPSAGMFGLSIVSLSLAFVLGFTTSAMLGLLGFWFLEVRSFIHIFMTFQYFLSGHMFPLSLLPEQVQGVVTLLPFAYETYYPTLILLQKLETAEVLRIIGVQAAWCGALLATVVFMWRRGLRRYAAFGG